MAPAITTGYNTDMTVIRALIIAGAAVLAACAPAAAPPVAVSGPAHLERHPDSARVLAALKQRGLSVVPRDPSEVEKLSDAPGFAYQIGDEWLHLHAYPDAKSAADARQRFLAYVFSRSAMIHWVGRPHLFQCRSALALYLGQAAEPLAALRSVCGEATPLYADRP